MLILAGKLRALGRRRRPLSHGSSLLADRAFFGPDAPRCLARAMPSVAAHDQGRGLNSAKAPITDSIRLAIVAESSAGEHQALFQEARYRTPRWGQLLHARRPQAIELRARPIHACGHHNGVRPADEAEQWLQLGTLGVLGPEAFVVNQLADLDLLQVCRSGF